MREWECLAEDKKKLKEEKGNYENDTVKLDDSVGIKA